MPGFWRLRNGLRRLRTGLRRLRNGLRRRLKRLRRAGREATAAKVQLAATWLSERSRHRLAVALLDLAEHRIGSHGDITLLRRTIPGYVGRVARRHLRVAARQASGTEVASFQVSGEPLTAGISPATVAVVRHTVQPHGHTFIRKSVHANQMREVRLYRSGLVSEPGRSIRAPTVLAVERQGNCWHLFLEDLQGGTRPRSAADFVTCARGLAELGARFDVDSAAELDWLAMGPVFTLRPYEGGIRACSRFLGPGAGERLRDLFERLCAEEADLVAYLRSLPRTLCHGDAHAGNMIMDPTQPGRTVLIDWHLAHVGPVGHDLGKLIAVPSNFARGAQLNPDACRQAYLDRLGAPASEHDAINFACDFTLVWHSLRWYATRDQPDPGWLRPADVDRVCRAAEALLSTDRVRHRSGSHASPTSELSAWVVAMAAEPDSPRPIR